jgi:hypothetical protein
LLDPVLAETGFFRVQDDFQLKGHAGCGYGFNQVEGITPYRIASYEKFLANTLDAVRWPLLGVRFVVTWRQALDNAPPSEVVAEARSEPGVPNEAGITRVYRLLAPEPRRAFVAADVRAMPDDDALYAAMAAPGFDPFATALVYETPGLPFESGPAGAGIGTVQVLADAPGSVMLNVDANAPGILVLSEAWYPGWAAEIDGAAAQALPVDGALVGVPVPAGQHTVNLRFRSPALLWGGLVSIAWLAAAALLALIRIQRK